jgi:DNA invertase Pin-like site-specific DNA recombinase
MSGDPDRRITPEHLCRDAVIYVRQSSPEQVATNLESQRLQRGLREKAVAFGWPNPVVIEDDLGISAAGYAHRPGFEALLGKVTLREVGIVLCTDASRLSRNSRDWAHLFQLCAFFDTLVADSEQVYDLKRPNDRLVMGIKGTVSEMELTVLRTRLLAGTEAKAARGELRIKLPPGYVYDSDDKIAFDPDERVKTAIEAMFERFDRTTSLRQLVMWYRDTKTQFPIGTCRGRGVKWNIPTYSTLRKLLVHPVYAGAYVYGRRPQHIEYRDGALVKVQRDYLPPERCRVCLRDHHPAYISWKQFEDHCGKLAQNRARWKMEENQGAIRDGLALLAGLMRCGACGARIYVSYKAASALYYCDGGHVKGAKRCQAFGSHAIDRAVGDAVCRALSPLGIEAAVEAARQKSEDDALDLRDAQLQVQAAQYETDRAFEQFDLVDPKNRLVAATLEQRLNEKLAALAGARERLQEITEGRRVVTDAQVERLHHMAADFPTVWNHPRAQPTLKKRLLRVALREVIVRHDPAQGRLEVTLHWQGGVHTRLHVKKRKTRIGSKADPDLVELVRQLAVDSSDAEVARILNMKKLHTPRGLPWTQVRVFNFRHHHRIPLSAGTPKGDLLGMQEAADYLGVSHNGLLGLERLGAIERNQVTEFAPWRVPRSVLDSEHVQRLVRTLKERGRLPRTFTDDAQPSLFDERS